ncbi:hypothetical protein MDOR_01570 [Mycolicibacterium doricum]|uniref:Uncharacterized protein n=1 Tax=Mycolicibacterium doricum TaxID=126673 RepID=A0A1X1TEG7_9MYCO|nr:O-methyltransferase [Mycolicibacterium doricum]MCV7267748.1 hypothetical protein [Mycolicibacterium doricum]ORV42937.1 hypothetical protein AWC01_07045 [Mycolicibacterium doricum]BBZ05988.1 hypothetical protein MDOR_01570 [Mycolicibacterium doricum]
MTSDPSYRKIDYSLRPAKAIERKMMIDLLRRLDRSAALSHYRYVGFGSPYFSDFALMHRALGIGDMVSIEHANDHEARFRFNAPFATIDLQFGEASEVLPELTWAQRSIVWLDYDGRLDDVKLEDIDYLARNLPTGSVMIVSVNAHPSADLDKRLEKAKEDLGNAVPRTASNESLGAWGTATMYREVISEQVKVSLSERNAGQSAAAQIHYQQLFNFHYSDGARMLTVGGVFYDAGQEGLYAGCAFNDFDFYRSGDQPYTITVPKLTLKEMRHLDAQLPAAGGYEGLDEIGIPIDDADTYAKLYRYFPKFVDIEA